MAGITLEQAEAKLALWMAADDAVAAGQYYQIGGRALNRANAAEIARNIDRWNKRVKNLSRGGRSVKGGNPVYVR